MLINNSYFNPNNLSFKNTQKAEFKPTFGGISMDSFKKTTAKISFGCPPHQNRRDEIAAEFIRQLRREQEDYEKKKRLEILNLEKKVSLEVAGFLLNFSNKIRQEAEFNPSEVLLGKTVNQKSPVIDEALAASPIFSDPVIGLTTMNILKKFVPNSKNLNKGELEQQFKDAKNATKDVTLITIKKTVEQGKVPLIHRDKMIIKELCDIAEKTDGCDFGAAFEEKLNALLESQRKLEKRKLKIELDYKHEIVFGETLTEEKRKQAASKDADIFKMMLDYNREILFNKEKLTDEEIHIREGILGLNQTEKITIQADTGQSIREKAK